jgi:hypothetical protein
MSLLYLHPLTTIIEPMPSGRASSLRPKAVGGCGGAERAEVAASKPVVLVVSPANDADIKNDNIKTQ